MEIPHAGRQTPSCIATLLYCERGACGPLGAGWLCCCSSCFFSESSTPPDGGDIGVVVSPDCDWEAGMIALGWRSKLKSKDSTRLLMKKPTARTAVVRVKRLAVPQLDMKPAPPPTPRPPPSDFCSNTVAINVATIIKWTTIMTVCISTFRHKPKAPASGCLIGACGVELARCYTIRP